jgi:hypothetical protein
LQQELAFLKASYTQQGIAIKSDTRQYIGRFSILNMIKKFATPNGLINFDDKTNIVSKIMSVALPMLLNKTVFSGAGFLTKGIAALTAGKIGKSLDAESLSGIFNGIKSFFTGKKKKTNNKTAFVDYGIPPDSETY